MESLFDLIDPPKKSTDWKWSFADYPAEKNGLKVFSCFACGGGSTMGYKLAGCEVIGDLEIDPKMNEIYQKNHHPRFNYCMDIREFNKTPNEELPEELFNLDILDGSPPCTTFSMAGDREDSWGKKKKFREGQAEQTLDDLSFIFIETVKKLQPRVVIMENVEGLLLGEAFTYVQQIYSEFQDSGYFVHHWLLKGEQMGIPQKRRRVFFVAIRADLHIDPSWLDMSFNYEPIYLSTIRDGIGKSPRSDSQNYKMLYLANEKHHSIKDVLVSQGKKPACFNDTITWQSEVMATIRASCSGFDGELKSYFSKNTLIHAQTFPEDFDFFKASVPFVLGMSVPPVMIKRIVTRLIEQGVFDYAKSMRQMQKA